jgi:alpha-tubulin suppressor-like RCC1 family protein
VLSENGKVYGMGSNRKLELGQGSSQQPKSALPIRIQALDMYMITKIAAGGFSAALTS